MAGEDSSLLQRVQGLAPTHSQPEMTGRLPREETARLAAVLHQDGSESQMRRR